jgi:exopolysaccharide biosynthesis polyprenyl glycosylphosphotransferase
MAATSATELAFYDDEIVGSAAARPGLTAMTAQAAAGEVGGQVVMEELSSAPLLEREALNRRLLAVADIAMVTLASLLISSLFDSRRVAVAALAGIPVVLFIFKAAGLYERDELRLVHSTLDELPLLLGFTGLFALGITILEPTVLGVPLGGARVAALWMVSFAAVATGRVLARSVAGRISPVERCLVIGDVRQVDRIRERVAASRARATVVAALPLAAEHADERFDSPAMIRRLVNELRVQRIIIAPTRTDTSGVVDLIRVAKAVGVRVSVLPRMLEVVGSAVEFDEVDGMTMLGVRRFGLARSSRLLKRAFDVVVATIGLIVVSPVIAGIALAIRLDSPGPIFFGQVRVGRDGKHFRIFKFRSMTTDAEARKDELRALNEAGNGLFKITEDPRVTRVGRFLRRSSLDELPQVFNVLRGEMSLVGPRPLVTDEDAQVLGLDRSRLHLTPGMTGPWQVLGSRVPMQEMVGIDYLYVANWSLWLDLKILLRTVRHVSRRGNV